MGSEIAKSLLIGALIVAGCVISIGLIIYGVYYFLANYTNIL